MAVKKKAAAKKAAKRKAPRKKATAKKAGAKKKGTKRKAGARKSMMGRMSLDDLLVRLEKQLPNNLSRAVRDLRKGIKSIEKQAEQALAEREKRWNRLEKQLRHEIAQLLRRLENTVEPPKKSSQRKS
jgi:hypothetical protein